SDGVDAVLLDFTSRVGDARNGRDGAGSGGGGGSAWPFLLVVGGAAALFLGWRSYRRRQQERADLEAGRQTAEQELTARARAGRPLRFVPACEADAVRVDEGLEPAAREVTVAGTRVQYWQGLVAVSWYGGYFGGFGFGGGFFPGLLVGQMLGGGLGPFGGFGD